MLVLGLFFPGTIIFACYVESNGTENKILWNILEHTTTKKCEILITDIRLVRKVGDSKKIAIGIYVH